MRIRGRTIAAGGRRVNRAGALLLAGCALSACGDSAANHAGHSDSPAAAEVNGRVISQRAIIERAETEEISPRAALDALIVEELLYQFSIAEGFAPANDHALDVKRLAVHALLREVVEREVNTETLDPAVLQEQSEALAAARSRPALRIASVVSVPFGPDSRSAGAAEAIAEQIFERLEAAETLDSLRATLGGDLPEDTMIQADMNYRENAEDTLRRVIYGLPQVGAVSEPFRAGDFMICARLENIHESQPVSAQAVQEEVRRDYLRHERMALLVRLAQAAESQFGVVRHEAIIDRAFALELEGSGAH